MSATTCPRCKRSYRYHGDRVLLEQGDYLCLRCHNERYPPEPAEPPQFWQLMAYYPSDHGRLERWADWPRIQHYACARFGHSTFDADTFRRLSNWLQCRHPNGTHGAVPLAEIAERLRAEVEGAAGAVQPSAPPDLAAGERDVLDALREALEPLRAREIAAKAGLDVETVKQYLRPDGRLRHHELVRRTRQGYIALSGKV